jgi:hypothetical protein
MQQIFKIIVENTRLNMDGLQKSWKISFCLTDKNFFLHHRVVFRGVETLKRGRGNTPIPLMHA